MSERYGLLVVVLNCSELSQGEFNEKYESEYISRRRRLKGFINAQQWVGVNDAKDSVVTYDLEGLDVLQGAEYKVALTENPTSLSESVLAKCKVICSFEAEQTLPGRLAGPSNAGSLLLAAMNVEPEFESEFNAWYDEEHIPYLAAVPGTLCARRFKTVVGTQKYLAIYHLESPAVFTSEAFKTAVETPWTHRLRPHTSDRFFMLLKPYSARSG